MLLPRNRFTDTGPIKGAIARMLYDATRVRTRLALLGTLSALMVMAAADYLLGDRWSLGLFYYLPVAFAAWRLGRMPGLGAGLLAALAWSGITLGDHGVGHASLALAWGFVSRALSFAVAALLVAEMREVFERERTLGRHCHLTGALSGRAFRDTLEYAVRLRGSTGSIALAYLDLDDFKLVNDSHGHAEGDERLRALALALAATLGPGDSLARTGGDEFVILWTGHEGSEEAAIERAHSAAGRALAQGPVPITCSMGGVIVPPGMAVDAGDLVRRADAAMYEGKRAGKGRLLIFRLGTPPRVFAAA